jgi:hypothetical protein
MFRRRPRDPEEPHGLLERVERAKAELVAAVPSPRGVPGRPVADALAAFERGLGEVAADPDVPEGWRRAIAESLSRAERLRLEAPPLDYEGLVASLADLLAPLDALDA